MHGRADPSGTCEPRDAGPCPGRLRPPGPEGPPRRGRLRSPHPVPRGDRGAHRRVPDQHVEEHGPLIEAIVAGEPERAARLARGHVEGFEQAIRAAV
ncbi:FCD domain-containing protein [Streptomyces luteogriseus]|uniref:FCD domain-containing protein n=1 Tax=Streptomyces luteogriseus TaxID=68233 RepID=UPI003593D984